jgi:type II secretory pathway component PulK
MTAIRGASGRRRSPMIRIPEMSDYQRYTYLPVKDVLRTAQEILDSRAGLKMSRESSHGATFSGAEGSLTLDAHRHGPMTDVVISTNQLRTSKIDTVARFLLNQLPYQPGDRAQGL